MKGKNNFTPPRPQSKSNTAQRQAANSNSKKSPVAPPAFRPQPLPAVLQRKTAAPVKQPPTAPQASRSQPAAPPVYRSNQAHRALQPKIAGRQGQQIVGSVVQLAERKWKFREIQQLVQNNPPQKNEDLDTYINRVLALATQADGSSADTIRREATKAHALVNPAPKVKVKKQEPVGPHPGWTVDKDRDVSKNYEFKSGGGSHRPKGMVWIDDNGDAWAEDKDEHAGEGYKKFQKVGNSWHYVGTYNKDLSFKNR